MTPREFNALMPGTRPALSPHDYTCRAAVRLAWLIARFVRRETVRYDVYAERFERSLRSFRRDIAVLRDAGLYLDADRQGSYRMICFRPERDAA